LNRNVADASVTLWWCAGSGQSARPWLVQSGWPQNKWNCCRFRISMLCLRCRGTEETDALPRSARRAFSAAAKDRLVMKPGLQHCCRRTFAEAGADLCLLPNCPVEGTPASTARPDRSDSRRSHCPFFRPPKPLFHYPHGKPEICSIPIAVQSSPVQPILSVTLRRVCD
jgi:hypothetical protein